MQRLRPKHTSSSTHKIKTYKNKRAVKIILQIGFLYIITLLGNMLQNLLSIPIPGSIIGLLLLFFGLTFKIIPVTWMDKGAGFILSYLSLLFIPATIGVMNYPSLASWNGMVVVLVVIVSTIVTMIVAGRVSQWFEELSQKRKEKNQCHKHSLPS